MKTIVIILFSISTIYCQHPKFIWPLKASHEYSEINDYYSLNNYVDQDPTSDPSNIRTHIKDWNCNAESNARTYNGHSGTDIDLWPFGWSMKNNNHVAVLAAADGVVVGVDQNQTDNNCVTGAGTWNVIKIRHNDNSESWYGHLKTNSSFVVVNDNVVAGQIIAYVGSSGSSSNPHLHFEVHDEGGNIIDPYVGACNPTSTDSWWLNQKPYIEPNIVRVLTHYGAPNVLDGTNSNFCPETEDKKPKVSFNQGEQLFIGNAFKDINQGDIATCVIYNPDGTLHFALPIVSPGNYTKWYSTTQYTLPPNAQFGTYKIATTYNNNTAFHYFVVGCSSVINRSANETDRNRYIAENVVNTSSKVLSGANIMYQASLSVRFTDGFKASLGSTLKTRLKGCNYSE